MVRAQRSYSLLCFIDIVRHILFYLSLGWGWHIFALHISLVENRMPTVTTNRTVGFNSVSIVETFRVKVCLKHIKNIIFNNKWSPKIGMAEWVPILYGYFPL